MSSFFLTLQCVTYILFLLKTSISESSPSRAKKRVLSFLKKDKKDKGRAYSSSSDLQNGAEPRLGDSPSPTTPSSTGSSLSVPGGGRSSSTGDLKGNKLTDEQRRLSDTRQGKEEPIGSPVWHG